MSDGRFKAPAILLGGIQRWVLIPPLALALFGAWSVGRGEPSAILALATGLFWGSIVLVRRPRRRQRLHVRLDPAKTLYVGARTFAEADQLRGIMLAPRRDGGTLMTLERKDGERVDLVFEQHAHVVELAASVRAGTALSSRLFRGHAPFGALSSLLVIAVAVFVTCRIAWSLAAWSPLLACVMACLALMAVPMLVAALRTWNVWVGAEGVRARRVVGGPARLVPFAEVTAQQAQVRQWVQLSADGEPWLKLELGNADEAQALCASVNHGREHAARGATAEIESQLERGGRSASEWLSALRAAGSGAQQNYRRAELPLEQLWAVVENPDAEPSARIGAGVRLRLQTGADSEARERLRLVARSTALPEVRDATEQLAAEAEEAALLEQLARSLG